MKCSLHNLNIHFLGLQKAIQPKFLVNRFPFPFSSTCLSLTQKQKYRNGMSVS